MKKKKIQAKSLLELVRMANKLKSITQHSLHRIDVLPLDYRWYEYNLLKSSSVSLKFDCSK
jgi:hypothetical protein